MTPAEIVAGVIAGYCGTDAGEHREEAVAALMALRGSGWHIVRLSADDLDEGLTVRERIGAALRRVIEQKGVTQAQAAEAAGYSQATFSDWVRGRSTPSIEQVDALERGLNLPPGRVYTVAGMIDPYTRVAITEEWSP